MLALVSVAVTACQEKQLAEIRFCADVRPNNPCVGEDTVFLHGTNVWAQLLLKPGFDGTSVTGNFYGYENGKRVFIEGKEHELNENQSIIMEALFINLCGNYEVEFVDSNGNLLAKGGFEIW